MPFSKKEPMIRRYPLLTVDGKDVCMNVRFCRRRKYWNFDTWPDGKLDEPISDCVFRYLGEKSGIRYALYRAFHDYPNAGTHWSQEIHISPIWLSGYSLTQEHMEHILKNALPHWMEAGTIIETWLAGRKWDSVNPRDMVRDLYDDEQCRRCRHQYSEWADEQFLKRKALKKSQKKNLVVTS